MIMRGCENVDAQGVWRRRRTATVVHMNLLPSVTCSGEGEGEHKDEGSCRSQAGKSWICCKSCDGALLTKSLSLWLGLGLNGNGNAWEEQEHWLSGSAVCQLALLVVHVPRNILETTRAEERLLLVAGCTRRARKDKGWCTVPLKMGKVADGRRLV